MMVLLLLVLIALVGGAWFGTLIARDAGYVLIAYDNVSLETSIWFALLALVVGYFLIRFLVVFVSGFVRSRLGVQLWNNDRLAKKARTRSVKGLLLMAEGKWLDAKKALLSVAPRSELPLVNYLSAARAAHELGDDSQRDALLKQAHESTPGSRFAVSLVQAQMQLDKQQWESALATLLELHTQSAGNIQVMRLMADCYQQVGDWQALINLLPAMKSKKVLDSVHLEEMEVFAWENVLKNYAQSNTEVNSATEPAEPCTSLWAGVPKKLIREPRLVRRYVEILINSNMRAEAEALLVRTLKHSWDAQLVDCYGKLQSDDCLKQLNTADSWFKQHPDDATLLLCLGRLCLMNQRWEQARGYFESSLSLEKSDTACAELARLCLALGELAKGREYMAQAMLLSGVLPDLPLPA